jgi:hypothetical protein
MGEGFLAELEDSIKLYLGEQQALKRRIDLNFKCVTTKFSDWAVRKPVLDGGFNVVLELPSMYKKMRYRIR